MAGPVQRLYAMRLPARRKRQARYGYAGARLSVTSIRPRVRPGGPASPSPLPAHRPLDPLPRPLRATFGALRHRNFRLFLDRPVPLALRHLDPDAWPVGWLVLQLSNSAFAVGLVSALGSLPILLFTLYGGVVADRVNKHRLILILQSLMLTGGHSPWASSPPTT